MSGEVTKLPIWRRAIKNVDDASTLSVAPDDTIERRMNILELRSAIISCQNRIVQLETQFAKESDTLIALQVQLAEEVTQLGIKAEVVRR